MKFLPLFLLLVFAVPLYAAEEPAGKVVSLTGKIKVFRGGSVRGETVDAPGTPLYIGDVVRTGTGTQALLLLGAADRVVVEEDSSLTLRARNQSQVDAGTVLFDIRKRGGLQGLAVTAATVTLGVKGTRFAVIRIEEKVSVYLKEGELAVTAGQGQIRHHSDPLGVRDMRQQMADDFRRTQEKMRAEFETAKEEMRQGNIAYVDQIMMRAGNFLQIEGNEAWDGIVPESLEEQLAIFDSGDAFFR